MVIQLNLLLTTMTTSFRLICPMSFSPSPHTNMVEILLPFSTFLLDILIMSHKSFSKMLEPAIIHAIFQDIKVFSYLDDILICSFRPILSNQTSLTLSTDTSLSGWEESALPVPLFLTIYLELKAICLFLLACFW